MQDQDRLNLISHHPRGIDSDQLGFSDYALTICDIIEELKVENSGMTIGLFGAWGSGKSSVLRMVRDRLDERRRETQAFQPLTVEFSAWQYQQDQIWVALLRTIAQTINNEMSFLQLTRIRFRQWRNRVQVRSLLNETVWKTGRVVLTLLVIFALLAFGLTLLGKALQSGSSLQQLIPQLQGWFDQIIPLLLPTTSQTQSQKGALDSVLTWVQIITGSLALLAGIWAGISVTIKTARRFLAAVANFNLPLPTHLLRPVLDKNKPFAAEQFRKELLELVTVVGRIRPLIVLIDDLDRTSVDQIVPVLEAMKHFGTEPNYKDRKTRTAQHALITFVLAADPVVIRHAIAGYYKDYQFALNRTRGVYNFAREYLEKVVQIPFELPPLSNRNLGILLGAPSYTSPRAADDVQLVRSALEKARPIFALTPKENPRLAVQANNTFQAIWYVVKRRGLAGIDPELLATLTLVRYVWPDVFEQMFLYPELFFDLRALVTEEYNEYCLQTEIEELLSLGCPSHGASMIEMIRQDYPDLLQVLRGPFSLPSSGIDGLISHITLIKDPPASRPIESGAALMSGDPTLIKFATRTNAAVKRERVLWLMEFLTTGDDNDPNASQEPVGGEEAKAGKDSRQQTTKQAKQVAALFALGRIRDGRAAEAIKQVVGAGSTHSAVVTQRAIYALAHLAEESTDPSAARGALAEILGDNQLPDGFKIRILRLLKAAVHDDLTKIDASIRRHVIGLTLPSEMQTVRDEAIRYAISGAWIDEAFVELCEADGANDDTIDIFLRIAGNCSTLSDKTGDFLLSLAASLASPHNTKAFDVLAKLEEPSTVIEYMTRLVETVDHTQDSDLPIRILETVGDRQATSGIEWRPAAWLRLKAAAYESPNTPWRVRQAYVRALGLSKQPEARHILKEILQEQAAETSIHNSAIQSLQEIDDQVTDPQISADIQQVLDDYEHSRSK